VRDQESEGAVQASGFLVATSGLTMLLEPELFARHSLVPSAPPPLPAALTDLDMPFRHVLSLSLLSQLEDPYAAHGVAVLYPQVSISIHALQHETLVQPTGGFSRLGVGSFPSPF